MKREGQATRVSLCDLQSLPMRAFHVTWMAFFSCFFARLATAALMPISQATSGIFVAVTALMLVGLFVQMSNVATYFVVPFINRKCLGSAAGIVGAGGNIGAVALGFLFQGEISWTPSQSMSGVLVIAAAAATAALASAELMQSDSIRSEEPSLRPVEASWIAAI